MRDFEPQPIPGHENIKEGETVYYLFDKHVGTLGIGQMVEPTSGVDYILQIGNSDKSNGYPGLEIRVRGWNIFRHAEVVENGEDLLPQMSDGGADITYEGVRSMLQDPHNGREMAIRLTPVAALKNLNTMHTLRSLGYRSVKELVGSPEDRHSNIARLQKTLDDARQGYIGDGGNNFVDLARFEPADALIHEDRLRSARIRIDAVNRQAMDRIYEYFGADIEQPLIFERYLDDGNIERRTIRPLVRTRAYFVESSLHYRDEAGLAEIQPYAVASDLFIGVPDADRLLEQDYYQRGED